MLFQSFLLRVLFHSIGEVRDVTSCLPFRYTFCMLDLHLAVLFCEPHRGTCEKPDSDVVKIKKIPGFEKSEIFYFLKKIDVEDVTN